MQSDFPIVRMTGPHRGGDGVDVRPVPVRGAAEDAEAISVLGLLNTVLRYRATIIGIALALATVVVVASAARPRSYRSAASFVPQSRRAQSGLSGLAAQFGVNLAANEPGQSPQFYVDLLGSRTLLGAAVDGEYAIRTDSGAVRTTLVELYGREERTPPLRREEAIKALGRDVRASVSTKTGVVVLTISARNAELAQQICDRLLQLLNRFNLESRQSQAASERTFTERRLNEVRGQLRAAEDRLQAFLLRNREYRNSPTLQFEQDRLSREVNFLQQLHTTLAEAFEQAKIEEVRDTPVITVVEAPEVPVRPVPRGLVAKGLLGLVGGLVLGTLLAFAREYSARAQQRSTDESADFRALRRVALDDLRRPWRPFARLFSRTRAAS